jgi:hypothetical protein
LLSFSFHQSVVGELAKFYLSRALVAFVVAQHSIRTRAAARWGVLCLVAMLLFELSAKLLFWVDISSTLESTFPYMTTYDKFEMMHVLFTPLFAGLLCFSAWIHYDMREYTFGVLKSLARTNAACNEYIDDMETSLHEIQAARRAIDKQRGQGNIPGGRGNGRESYATAAKRAQVAAAVAAARASQTQDDNDDLRSGGTEMPFMDEGERRERLARVFDIDQNEIMTKAGFEGSRKSSLLAIGSEVTAHSNEMRKVFASTLGAISATAGTTAATNGSANGSSHSMPAAAAVPITATDAVELSTAAMGGAAEGNDGDDRRLGTKLNHRGPVAAAARTVGTVRRRSKRTRG